MACAVAVIANAQGVGSCSSQFVTQDFGPFCRTLERNPRSSLAHFGLAELLFRDRNFQSAANEFREALSGDLEPKWTEPKARIGLGKIFLFSGQRDRAINEFRLAIATGDDTPGILDEAASVLKNLGSAIPVDFPVMPVDARIPNSLPSAEPIVEMPANYTNEARIAELEGVLLLEGTIGEDGSARNLTVVRPLGLGLEERAMDAVRFASSNR